MSYTRETLAELNVLMLYDLSTNQEGLKIHKTAEPSVIAAARSLYKKGILTHEDGGYLTSLGREAADHAQSLFTMLDTHA